MTDTETAHVYILIDPRTDNPRYVGATTDPDNRRQAHVSHPHSDPLNEWINDLQSDGEEPRMVVLSEHPLSEISDKEEYMIEQISTQHDLLNGSARSGYHHCRPKADEDRTEDRDDGDIEEREHKIEELRERKQELLQIAWEKEAELIEIREGADTPGVIDKEKLAEMSESVDQAISWADGTIESIEKINPKPARLGVEFVKRELETVESILSDALQEDQEDFDAVQDARESYEDVDGNGVDDAIARLEELTEVNDG
ncbi:hypothetical protein [Halorubrum sp. Atlit-8R]|uniref:hypothetical protein n=1 Tax=Halorubrum sp. Atlit-8R TaxID=2282126 RepID=UPI0011C431FE|nr:hypothetical protein [Halorubrum sp. Atlit-8R]